MKVEERAPSGPYEVEDVAAAFLNKYVPNGRTLKLPNGRWTVLQGNEDRDTPSMGVWWEDWKMWWKGVMG